MKINKIDSLKSNFKPYKKTIEILVESEFEDELLNKLKEDFDAICLCFEDGENLSSIKNFSIKEEDLAVDFMRNILSNL